jgi:predicted transcriptional regulator
MAAPKLIDKELAAGLRERNLSYAAIGKVFGVSAPAVFFALNPEKRAEYDIRQDRKKAEKKSRTRKKAK